MRAKKNQGLWIGEETRYRIYDTLRRRKLNITAFSAMIGVQRANLSLIFNGRRTASKHIQDAVREHLGIDVTGEAQK
jgi:hypothetical protein